jgi:hypothetical protein
MTDYEWLQLRNYLQTLGFSADDVYEIVKDWVCLHQNKSPVFTDHLVD